MKRLLLGDEALALGAINAGLSGVYAYPGTPSTEITEFIQEDALAAKRGIHSRWCTNEKTAMEAALGMSYAGKRALVCMKHVGMNVCADAFVNSAITGVNGGLVVVAADDPSMHSSQNEQDSRYYGKFAMVPTFEPSTQQEAYDMISEAFDLSEKLGEPVLFRMVTRLAHSRASVEVGEAREENAFSPSEGKSWVLLPRIARVQYEKLIQKQPEYLKYNEAAAGIECQSKTRQASLGVIACGIAYNYVKESGADVPILKINRYPIPEAAVKALADRCKRILVVEDGQPFAEYSVRVILGHDYKVEGRLTGKLPRTGELTPDSVAQALGCGNEEVFAPSSFPSPRPPQLCPGCGHRDVYSILKKVAAGYPGSRIFGDIGCYTLGALPPFESLHSTIDMGASITMAKGAADAGLYPAIAVIGDSTFTHSGMTGLLDAVNDHSNITVIISDNLTTGMTGGQDSAGTSKYEAICLALGVERDHLHVVVPLPANSEVIASIIRKEIEYNGVSVIIPRRECMQTLKRHKKQ